MKAKLILFLIAAFPFGATWGQTLIKLNNPSFEEDEPAAGIVPKGWKNLGATDQTPPDVQPGFFEANMSPQHGKNYLGLVVRENNTWEGVGQKLSGFYLEQDASYSFSLWLNRSNSYKSPVQGSDRIPRLFTAPTILKIWGYNTKTGHEELLAESEPVSHSKWVRYEFVLIPTLEDYDEIDLMAYYAPGHENENGNLLIDNCSPIEKIDK